ncbi:bifunctional enoyl-CoA hydratase/phosphate acetyltransferase [candidate division KSB1 bacterium]|nr:bifunctional enoyl-CoA hydratase/phosphate acetyltransferase [candidate division KSB1 bacterium]RQW01712.1 MAG: bifunctional enoyl-CoA hydratase/phosphate acetyltransferase [candidate division KSB1 bacterium]
MISSFRELVDSVKGRAKKTIAVAMAEGEDVLKAVAHAHEQGLADAVLVGNRKKIIEIAEQAEIDLTDYDIINTNSEVQSVVRSIQMVRENLADTLMKGVCSTATLLKGILDKEHGIRTEKLLSHVAAFELDTYPKLLFMSDGGINITPNTEAKIAIINNAVNIVKRFGVRKPKVALITAIEKVNYQAMPCTVDAAIICKMAERGQISSCIIDGPLALDNAISKKACEIKGIKTPINGEADILVMPDIETGNVFYKTLNFFTNCRVAGTLVGAQVPVVVTSRADSKEIKFNSIAMAMQAS